MDWLCFVYRSFQENFNHKLTSLISVERCILGADVVFKYWRILIMLSCYDMELRLTRSKTKYRPFSHLLRQLAYKEKRFYVCVDFFRPTREFFTHIWRRDREGLRILTLARPSWPLSSKGSLASTPTMT